MSNDTNYELTFLHEDITYLEKVLAYLSVLH